MSDPTPPRSDDDLRTLLGAWAVDALDDDERADVDDLLARDADAAREAAGLRATAALLGAAAARAVPPEVRAATLAAVARTPQDAPTAAGTRATEHVAPHAAGTTASGTGTTRPAGRPGTRGPRGRAPVRRRRAWTALVACLAVLAVGAPSVVAWQQAQRARVAEARAERLGDLLAAPDARILTGDLATGGRAVAVVTADEALLTAQDVAAPGDGRVYQLWVLQDGAPVPAGVADVTAGGFTIATAAYRTGDALAVTVEPAGGSSAPTTEPVVVLRPA
ncbi:anti-sigma factor domain-containing protein [Cellulomonas sp. NPDC057328]|uniref:anti-sigma factor n=1 Tax=Cellulomonas sp. NPDC057328 TaxID=3346101 RepID=UPI003636F092